jgi:hypothetical protein
MVSGHLSRIETAFSARAGLVTSVAMNGYTVWECLFYFNQHSLDYPKTMKKLYFIGVVLLLIFSIQTVHADTYPNGCTATTKYSVTTGQLCTAPVSSCAPGDLYSAQTGQPCSSSPTYLPGCTSTIGYSITTGNKCDGSAPVATNATQVVPNNDQQELQSEEQSAAANTILQQQEEKQAELNQCESSLPNLESEAATLSSQMTSTRSQGLAQITAQSQAEQLESIDQEENTILTECGELYQ